MVTYICNKRQSRVLAYIKWAKSTWIKGAIIPVGDMNSTCLLDYATEALCMASRDGLPKLVSLILEELQIDVNDWR